MPSPDFEARYKRLLEEIVLVSTGIRNLALQHTNDKNFGISERLRRRLETIRLSADTILEAFTKSSFSSYAFDERITDWLMTGEPRSCLLKLKALNAMLDAVGQDRPARAPTRILRRVEDKLDAAMNFFDQHNGLFHFLLASDIRDREEADHDPQPPQTHILEESSDTESGYHTAAEWTTKEILQQKLEEVIRWLGPVNSTEKHNDIHKLRQEGTCTWFPATKAYKAWRFGGNKFLWVHGKAGCGKSVLAASTIEYIKTTLRKQEVVVYFYCDFRSERWTSATELMRSLLSQLLRHFSENTIDPGKLPNEILQRKSDGTLSLNDLDKLCDLVSRAATCFDYYPIVVIDALDECAQLEALLGAVLKLNQGDVRLVVTSRSHRIIMDRFDGLGSLSLDDAAKETAGDIALHISRELGLHEQLRSADSETKAEVKVKLNQMAEGRFRWVQCQIDTLKRCVSREELRNALDNLPNELEATYERILGAIDERNLEGKLARRTLAWLVVAMEPLRLAQLVDGFTMNTWPREIEHEMGAALVHALSSLVAHNEETDVLALSHFTVKEYLTSAKALPTYQIIFCEAHAVVSEMCMHYVSVYLAQVPFHGIATASERFPMLSYILSCGFNHLSHVDPLEKGVLKALITLGTDVHYHPSHWEFLVELREHVFGFPYPPWPSSRHDFVSYILIAYSLPMFLRSFLLRGPLNPRIGTNPLVYAADLRKTEHGMTLLEYGADVDKPGFMIDDSRHALPLEVATDLGDDVLVSELLRKGALVTSELLATAICMPWCPTQVLVKLLQTDKFVECAHELGDERLYRSVFSSARPNPGDRKKADEDHVTLARILNRMGVDLSADNPFGAELFERAVHAAHMSMLEFLLPPNRPPPSHFLLSASTGDTSETVSVVRFLLEKGVDVHATSDGSGDTALHFAVICPWEPRRLELTQMLVDAGCSPHALNMRGQSPLTIALKSEYFSVGKVLIFSNVPLPTQILPLAIKEGCGTSAIQWLVLQGANIHSITANGESALHVALSVLDESKRIDLLGILIKAGSDPLACNLRGQTVLEVAIRCRDNSVIKYLLSQIPDYLSIAVRRHSASQSINSLTQEDAHVHLATTAVDTLLHSAIIHCDELTILDLVKHSVEAACIVEQFLDVVIDQGYTLLADLLLPQNLQHHPDLLLTALQRQASPRMIGLLISKGVDLHSTTSDGDTALHFAIAFYTESTCLHLANIFIEAGCNLDVSNQWGQTVLDAAIHQGYTALIDLLLSHDLTLRSDILLIALRRRLPFRIVQSIVLKGADVHATTPGGDTVLHLAIAEYVEPTLCDLVKLFLDPGSNMTSFHRCSTALNAAIMHGYISVADILLSHDIPICPDILSIALRQRLPSRTIQSMIRKGADVHITMSSGNTLLHLAVVLYPGSACLSLVANLIEAGCNLSAFNIWGQTALDVAINCRNTPAVDLLLSHNPPLRPDILSIALQRPSTPHIIQSLILQGADVHSITSNEDSLLYLAVAQFSEPVCLDLVDRLIRAGCNPATDDPGVETALELAIKRGYAWVVDRLLSHDAVLCPHILLLALQRRSPSWIVRSLVLRGADVRSTTSDGDTVLHLAIASYPESTCLDLIDGCLAAGCPLTASNRSGWTVLDMAVHRGYTSAVDLLLSHCANDDLPSDHIPALPQIHETESVAVHV